MALASVYDARSMFAGMKAPRKATDFDVEYHLAEIADLESDKQQQLSTWRDAQDLLMPQRQNLDGEQVKGKHRQPQQKFDSYPEDACNRGIGNIIASMWLPGSQWSEIAPGASIDQKRAGNLAKGTEKITEMIFEDLGNSRFNDEMHSATHDLMIAEFFLFIDIGDADRPFKVTAGNLSECLCSRGMDGEIEGVYRRYKCSPRKLKKNWRGAKLSQRVELLITSKSREKIEIVEATTYEEGRGYRFTVFDPTDKHVFYDVPPIDPTEPCRAIVGRMYVRPDGSPYGPGIIALAESRTVNKTKELSLLTRARGLASPILFDTRTGINPETVRLGANYVGAFDGTLLNGADPFVAIPPTGSPEWATEDMRDSHMLIDRILFAEEDIPPPQEFKDRTAYEVATRKQMKLVQRGVNLGRLQHEVSDAIMYRLFWIEARLGKLGNILPDELAKMLKSGLLKIKPLGAVVQAQRAEKARGKLAFVSSARAAVGDEAAALQLKIEEIVISAGKISPDIDEADMRDEDEREAMQKQAAAVVAQQQAGQQPTMQQPQLPGVTA